MDEKQEFTSEPNAGISKRFYAACAAMNGILSNQYSENLTFEKIVEASYDIADELISQENQ